MMRAPSTSFERVTETARSIGYSFEGSSGKNSKSITCSAEKGQSSGKIRIIKFVRAHPCFDLGHPEILKQKIPLRHRQHLGRRAGEELAVGAHLVGLGIDCDVRRR